MNDLQMELLKKRFQNVLKGTLAASLFSICAGILALILGVHEVLTEPATPVPCSLGMALLGAGHMLNGIWGVSFSKVQERNFSGSTLVVYEPAYALGIAWVLWLGSMVFSALAFVFCVKNDPESMILVILALVFLCLAFWCFSDYRCRSVVLFRGIIEYTNCFGRKKTFHEREIRNVKGNAATESFRLLDTDGKKLFVFETNMVNADVFMSRFPEVFQKWNSEEQEKKNSRMEELLKENAPAERVRKVRIIGWILFVVDVLLLILLAWLLGPMDLLPKRRYFLLMSLIPFDFFVFSWIFKDVVGASEFSRRERDKEKEWKKHHVEIWGRLLILVILNYLPFEALSLCTQCVRGTYKMVVTGLVLFGLLMLISIWRLGLRRSRVSQLLATMMFGAFFCLETTLSLFYATTGSPEHYPAEIVSMKQSDDSYYVTVVLRDGTEEKLQVFEQTYENICDGKEMVVCEYTGIFDTEFVFLHLPE